VMTTLARIVHGSREVLVAGPIAALAVA